MDTEAIAAVARRLLAAADEQMADGEKALAVESLSTAVMLLDSVDGLAAVHADQPVDWLRRLDSALLSHSGHAVDRATIDRRYMALHAAHALRTQIGDRLPSREHVPQSLLPAVQALDWASSATAAASTALLLTEALQSVEHDANRTLAVDVRQTLTWLSRQDRGDCHLVPDRSGDSLTAVVASALVRPFFSYTLVPAHRTRQRVEIARLHLTARGQALASERFDDYVALLDMLAAARIEQVLSEAEIGRVLGDGRGVLRDALRVAAEGGYTRSPASIWKAAAVVGHVERALGTGGEAAGASPRWPMLGFIGDAGARGPATRLRVRTALLARAIDVPPATAPRVTVVVPCFNLGFYLPDALESVCNQTYRDLAVVVVDDGSDDELTAAVLDQLPEHGVRVITQPNSGVAAARNRGVRESSSELFCCLDADDRLRPQFLQRTIEALDADQGCAFAGCWIQCIGESDLLLDEMSPKLPELLAMNQTMCTSTFRRSAWESVGGIRGGFSVPGIEDWDFWLSIVSLGGRGTIVPEVLFEYRIRPRSMSDAMYDPTRWAGVVAELVQRHEALFRAYLPDVVSGLHRKWTQQRAWLADREGALQWWQTQAIHLSDAAQAARAFRDERERRVQVLEQEIEQLRREAASLSQGSVNTRTGPKPDTVGGMSHPNAVLQDLVQSERSIHDMFPDAASEDRALSTFRQRPSGWHFHARTSQHSPPAPLPLNLESGRAATSRVCIATPDIQGPVRTGGIGSAYTSLARVLRSAGHEVTVLYTGGDYCEEGTLAEWVAAYAENGIAFVPLPASPLPTDGPRALAQSHDAYQWLRAREFDIIHFPEMFGHGACSVEAKRLGIAFANTLLCVGLHSPTVWHRLENQQTIHTLDDLYLDALERKSVALADAVVSPSRYLVNWIDRHGWSRPQATYLHPYASQLPSPRIAAGGVVDEIVFFGRLETRKGLGLFCDALDHLFASRTDPLGQVTFLGKGGTVGGVDGEAFVAARSARWPVQVEVHTDWSRDKALHHLSSRRAIAVMPSLSDNTPNTVIECLSHGVPFISTRVGGIPEMLSSIDRDRVLVEPQPEALASQMQRALEHGWAPASPACSPTDVNERWSAWHARPAQSRPQPWTRPPEADPLVSACMATRNRPRLVCEALDSLASQTYRNLELIVVDDGSDDAESILALKRWRDAHPAIRFTLVEGPRRFPGAARNRAARLARGKYILFMDDDNVADAEEVQVLVSAAEHAQMDVVTCGFRSFQEGISGRRETFRWLPIGPAMPLGTLVNCFGDTNMLVRRDAFFEIGGFDEEAGAGLYEDWIFHSRAFLANKRAGAVPEALFGYRRWDGGTGQNGDPHASYGRTLAPYLDHLAPEFGLLAMYAAGAAREASTQSTASGDLALKFLRAAVVARFELSDLTLSHQLTAEEDGGLAADGDDPQLILPFVRTGADCELLLRVTLSAPRPTTLQLFWIADGDPPYYAEDRSTMAAVDSRESAVTLRIPTGRLAAPLRLDPGFAAGTYRLRGLELRQSAEGTNAAGPRVPLRNGLRRWLEACRRIVSLSSSPRRGPGRSPQPPRH